jgi:hypothetical protein
MLHAPQCFSDGPWLQAIVEPLFPNVTHYFTGISGQSHDFSPVSVRWLVKFREVALIGSVKAMVRASSCSGRL